MIAFVKDIASKKPVVICGDMNIVRHDADSYDHISVQRKGCFYPEEHEGFERLILEANLIDAQKEENRQHGLMQRITDTECFIKGIA